MFNNWTSHGRGQSFPWGWVSDAAGTCYILVTHRLVIFGTFEIVFPPHPDLMICQSTWE